MNKLLLLTFLVTLFVLAAAGSQQEEEDSSLARQVREAGQEKGGRKIAENNGRNKNRRRKNKKTGINERTKKKSIEKKAKKVSGQQKQRQKNTKVKQAKTRKLLSRQDSSCTANATCLDNAMSFLKIMKDNVGNYLRQDKRLRAANKTGAKKNGKKGLFGPVLHRILAAGGGNKSLLTCSGSSTSEGAKKLTSLSSGLINCEANINTSCNSANFPLPNITEVDLCLGHMKTYKTMVDNCLTMEGAAACGCWSDSTFTDLVTTVKACKISTESKAMVAQLNLCKANFSECKKYEDESLKAISACSVTTSSLVATAAALTANSAGLTAANTTAATLAGTSSSGRVLRAAATTCAEVIAIIAKLITFANEAAASPMIAALAADVTNVTGITCTDEEKASLTTQVTSITTVVEEIADTLTSIQNDLLTATGSTASSATIANSTSSTATATSGGRMRNIAARHIMSRLNLREFRGRK